MQANILLKASVNSLKVNKSLFNGCLSCSPGFFFTSYIIQNQNYHELCISLISSPDDFLKASSRKKVNSGLLAQGEYGEVSAPLDFGSNAGGLQGPRCSGK